MFINTCRLQLQSTNLGFVRLSHSKEMLVLEAPSPHRVLYEALSPFGERHCALPSLPSSLLFISEFKLYLLRKINSDHA